MASLSAREAPMRRVMVVGCAGAGKTTFAPRLAEQFGGHLHITRLVCDGEVENFLAADRAA
jgi:uridine kinase